MATGTKAAASVDQRLERWFLPLALAGLLAGALAHLAGAAGAGHDIWAVTTVIGLIPATWWVIEALRSHHLGVDVIALLALAGTLVVGETLAGAVITVMLASGRALESWAAGRARRELRLLLDRAPASLTACQETPPQTWPSSMSSWATGCSSSRARSFPSMDESTHSRPR